MTVLVARRAASTALLVAMLATAPAYAMDAEVTSDTAAQFYNVSSPSGITVLTRRRLTTTIGVAAYNLVDTPDGDPRAADISFRARVRYDADYGASGSEQDPTQTGSFVPGYDTGVPGAVDVMYAYLEGRRLLHGMLGFKLGRQYVTDALGWWSFDGGEVSLTTPYYLKAEAYGGLEERGGMPLSTSRFEADGIWRGDRNGYDPSLYPSFQPAAIAPAYGVALESVGVTWLHARLSYRRVYNTGGSNVSEFASGIYAPAVYDGTRISTDKLGYAVDANLPNVGGVKAGVVYDLYRTDVTNLYATVDGYLGRKVTVSADYDYYVPSFDADSIWNFFAGEPMNDVGVRANVDVSDRISVAGGGRLKIFDVQTAPLDPGGTSYSPYTNFNTKAPADMYPSNGHPFDEGANLSGRYRTGETLVGLRANGNWGGEGDRVGADVSAQRIFETRYVASVRTGVWQWDDKLRPDRDATSFNYVLGLGYRFLPRSQALVEWEHDINRLVGQRFRLMLWLTLATK
ncbi:MAG: hypothetical protein ACLP1X_32335 [Polyangiaceae bacterium]